MTCDKEKTEIAPGKRIDLHTHSTASDGSETPSRLVQLACEAGLSALALSDHDTVSGLDEFLDAAKERELLAVPAVELSSMLYNKELHIVGLFIDHKCPALLELLTQNRLEREARNRSMVEKLSNAGYPVTYEELLQVAGGESIGRPHLAQLLIRKGYFKEPQEVFDKCLKRGTRTFTPRKLPSPEICIRAIHQAGGLAIWAHPIYRQAGERSFLKKFLRKLKGMGLDGVEGYYSLFSAEQCALVAEMAEANGLLVSGGSDFHGRNQPGLYLGSGYGSLNVPWELLGPMQQRLQERSTVCPAK